MWRAVNTIVANGKHVRPLMSASLKLPTSSTIGNKLIKNDFHTTVKQMGGGDHEFIVIKI